MGGHGDETMATSYELAWLQLPSYPATYRYLLSPAGSSVCLWLCVVSFAYRVLCIFKYEYLDGAAATPITTNATKLQNQFKKP